MSAFAAAALTMGTAYADATPDKDTMEKCTVVGKNNEGLIKARHADCASPSGKNSCSSTNVDNDPTAWILVPKGECAKINMGDFSGVSDEIKSKIKVEYFDNMSKEELHEKAKELLDDAHKK